MTKTQYQLQLKKEIRELEDTIVLKNLILHALLAEEELTKENKKLKEKLDKLKNEEAKI